ncbi:MAG: T9SS C-terminal target domain-containing protein [Bacteroidetes bacterium]|nr:MAG: T9SS C-terminal target domain-containing protein [Bacteroidota bacterium]
MNMDRFLIKTLVVGILVVFCFHLNAQTIFVKPGGTGDGTSWANATGNLKNAIGNATAGMQVWVAEGTYTPTQCNPCTFDERNLSFFIPEGVKVYGGFAGTESALSERDYESHPTYLSGDLDGDGTLANNSYSIVFFQWVTDQTLLDGFILTGGNADFASALGNASNSGAAIYNNGSLDGKSSNPVIQNCTFTNNYAWGFGGAVYNDGAFGGLANPTFVHCRFENNSAQNAGGAFYNSGVFGGETSPVLTDCIFENNISIHDQGGALFNSGASEGHANPVLTNCVFTNNQAGDTGGAVFNFANQTGHCAAVFKGCRFENNQALRGGALYNDGSFSGMCNPTFTDCMFLKNHSTDGDGGGVYNSGIEAGHADPIFSHCIFTENESSGAGGGIFSIGVNGNTAPVLTNCTIYLNIADTFGGGIYNMGKSGNANPVLTNCLIYKNIAYSSAGGMYNLGAENGNSSPVITNCTFWGNMAIIGGAIYNNASGPNGNSSPVITNTIIWGNQAELGHVFRNILGTPQISYSLVDAPDCEATNSSNGMGHTFCGDGMIFNQYPEFQDTNTFDLRLKSTSPAVDAGDNAAINATGIGVDLDSLPRIYNGIVDMGPYEFGSFLSDVPVITAQPFDQDVCEGSSVEFVIHATAPGTVGYQWRKDGSVLPGAASNILSISNTVLSDAGSYDCLVFNMTGDTVVSNPATLMVTEKKTVSISISASALSICQGEPVVFTTMTENGGTAPVYQWYLNGNPFGGSISTFTSTDLNDGDELFCTVTSSENCVIEKTATSNTIQVTVNAPQTPKVEILTTDTMICAGETVHFEALAEAGGDHPVYQWQVNGVNVGDNLPFFDVQNLVDGDQVRCLLTSDAPCVTTNMAVSNVIQVEIVSVVSASVSIEVEASAICMGSEAVFSAMPVHGGDSPLFRWYVNGILLQTGDMVFSTANIADGDVVYCEMESNLACVSNELSTSNEIEISVLPLEVPNIHIEPSVDTTICLGDTVRFEAVTEHGGDMPQFEWYLNNLLVSTDADYFVTNNLLDGDEVSCVLISNEMCVTTNEVVSNVIEVSVDSCMVGNSNVFAQLVDFQIYPNPAYDGFWLTLSDLDSATSLEIVDATGHIFYRETLKDGAPRYVQFMPAEKFHAGVFWVRVWNKNGMAAKKIVVE